MSETSEKVTGETTEGRHLLTAKDLTEWVDAEGSDLPPVPKHWGKDQMPPGAQKKSKASGSSSGSSSSSGGQRPSRKEGEGPPRNGAGSGLEEWVAFAKEKGAKDEDLVDGDGAALARDALIEKYGTPAS